MTIARSIVTLSAVLLILPIACGNDDGDPVVTSGGANSPDEAPVPELVCPSFDGDAFPEMTPFVVEKASYFSPLVGAPSVGATGSFMYSIPIDVPPGRRLTPKLGIVVDNGGVSISGLSSISRCGSNLAQDDQIRGVMLTAEDNYCFNGSRLIAIGTGSDSIGKFAEYRTAVDSRTKILGYGAAAADGFDVTYFVAYAPSGTIAIFGKSQNARVDWRGLTRTWNIESEMDRRSNTIHYAYANLTDGSKDPTTQESAIRKITYTGSIDENGVETLGDQAIRFQYDSDDRYGKLFYEGEEITRKMRLAKIVTQSKGIDVRSYRLAYEDDPLTNTALLTKVEECVQDDLTQCKPPVQFHWDKAANTGFAKSTIGANVPSKSDDDQFSWTVADVDGNGAPDLIKSTKDPNDGVNRLFVYTNDGTGLFVQAGEWYSAPFPASMTKQWQITPLDENADGRIDLLIDQDGGTGWSKLRVLRSVANPSPHFELVTTNIPRVSQHRADEFTTDSHSGYTLADIDADGMSDIVRCQDTRTWKGHANYVENDCNADADCEESLAKWTAHLWRPGGFEATERPIPALNGISCWTMSRFFGAVDWNADGQTDLVTPGKNGKFLVHTLDVPSLQWQTEQLSMALPNALGVAVQDDPVSNYVRYPLTKIRAAQMEAQWQPLRAYFPDLNGDAYPDLVFLGGRGTTLKPIAIINEGRDEYTGYSYPFDAVDNNVNTFYLSPFVRFFDYGGDGRDDLILPIGGSCPGNPDGTCYVVFESGKVGEAAQITKTSVPFENQVGESVAPQYLLKVADVDLNGRLDILHPAISSQMQVFVNQSKPNRLLSITTGRNPLDPGDAGFLPDVSIEYGNLVNPEQADPNNTCEYPRACVTGGMPVVSAMVFNNGQNQPRRIEKRYREARAHRLGRVFLGFGEVETLDVDTGAVTLERFDNVTFDEDRKTFPFAGLPIETRTTVPVDGKTLESTTVIAYEVHPTNAGKTYFVNPRKTERIRKEDATVLEHSTTVVADVDEYGNALDIRRSADGVDLIERTYRHVKNDSAAWLLGLVEYESTCSTALGETKCRTSTGNYNTRGELIRAERAPDDSTAHLTTFFLRDSFGNTTNVISEDDFGNRREACVTFEPSGTFPWASRNAEGHTEHNVYNRALGVQTATRDANGLVTKAKVDTFGQTLETIAPGGVTTKITRSRVKTNRWITRVKHVTPGHGEGEAILDSFGRVVQSRMRGPDLDTAGISSFGKSVWIVQDTHYDFFGRLDWQSIPRIDGDLIAEGKGSSSKFDNAGRVIKTASPLGTTTFSYDGNDVSVTQPGPAGFTTITKRSEHDALGRVIAVTDAKQGVTKNVYGPFSQLRRVHLPDGAIRETTPDDYGRVVLENDPDRGKTLLEYNGFDELTHLHDALDRHFAFEHDKLSRLTRRAQGIDVSTMEYDTAPNGIGFSARTTGPDGHKEEYEYDTLSRPTKATLQLADGRSFAQSLSYDPYGRPLRQTYPNGLSVVREYDSVGTLVAVRNGITRASIWNRTMVDVSGQTMLEAFGNGATTERVYDDETTQLQTIFTMAGAKTLQSLRLEYDAQQNVVNRFDALQGKREHFKHDALNRITCSRIDSCQPGQLCGDINVPCDVDVQYNSTGSITFKSDVGQYVPDPAHPHAVQFAGGMQFAHDAVGNQIERPGTTITYTDFDLPRQYLPKAGGASTLFEYSAAGQRVRRIRGEQEIVYLGDAYELETNGNTPTERFYVSNDERVVAIAERSNGAETWQFVHVDHLGSVDAISDASGNEVERRSFDAWGAPRHPKWGHPAQVPGTTSTRRGFTWHEADDEVGLVNAKGRLYDPKIARFLQVDPIISEPLDAQTHNPYSYVRNRPLVFTDPSGFTEEEAWRLWRADPMGTLGMHVTFDKLTPPWAQPHPEPRGAAPPPPSTAEVTPAAPDQIGVSIAIPVVLTPHPSGQGTDDPFAVFPSDIEIGYGSPVTTLDQLVTGDMNAGRRFFLTESDPGLVTSLNHVFGPARQTIALRPRIGGDARDYRTAAIDHLIGEGILAAATILTPGPLDDIAAAGLRGGAKALAQNGPRVSRGSEVTEQLIREVMKDAPLKSQQDYGVSLPLVQEYVDLLLKGSVAPAIHVEGQIIVNGNHRYIAGRIVGREPEVQAWLGGRGPVVDWSDMPIVPEKWKK